MSKMIKPTKSLEMPITENCFCQGNIFAFLAFMFSILFHPSTCSISFNISHFDYNTSDVFYEGDGNALSGYVDLTEAELYFRVGRVVYSEPVQLWDSSTKQLADFTSHFSFTIDNSKSDDFSDGLAFFFAPVGYPFPPNSAGGYLGLLNSTTGFSSENQIIMVEFDTWKNVEYDPTELDTHVGININKITSAVYAGWDARSASLKLCNCWITYNSTTKNLSVFWTYEENPVYNGSSILSYTVDLMSVLPELVTVGFSAATGLYGERHMINSWEFSSNWGSTYGKSLTQPIGRWKFRVSILVALVIFFSLLLGGAALCTIIIMKKWNSKKAARKGACADSGINEYIEKGVLPRIFSYQDLVNATNGFASDRRLGQGGSGHVYKGVLRDIGCLVAVKKISSDTGHSKKFFINEVKIISRLIHQNLVQLIGWCDEQGKFILVYEYVPNGSLDRHLYGDKRTLLWETRYKIALGLALALHYLHEEAGKCVIHGQIKSANVLLDKDFETKLGDFAVAKRVDSQLRTQGTSTVGTYGYLVPEYLYEGRVSKASDVFSFGAVALEIACGRKAYLEGECHVLLVKQVWQLYVAGNTLGAADERLNMVFCEKEMECLLLVGLWCTHPNHKKRPKIGEVIKVLKFEAPLPVLPEDMHDQDRSGPHLRSRTSLASSGSVIRSMSQNGVQDQIV